MSNELYHYGVKGMKWGVRKTNRAVRKANRAIYFDRHGGRKLFTIEPYTELHANRILFRKKAAAYANKKNANKDYSNAHYHQASNDWFNAVNEYLDSHMDEYQQAAIKDLRLEKYKEDKDVQRIVRQYLEEETKKRW